MLDESAKLWRHRNNGVKLREPQTKETRSRRGRNVFSMRTDRISNVSSRRVSSESRSSFRGVRADYFTGYDRSHGDQVQRMTAKTESGVYCVCLLGFIRIIFIRYIVGSRSISASRSAVPVSAGSLHRSALPPSHIYIILLCAAACKL